MNIFERIQEKASEQNISIKKLEQEIGLGNGVIKKWSTSSPQCNKLLLVANYLQVSLDWLVTGKNTKEALTEEEKKILEAYRKAEPQIQFATRKLLDVKKIEIDQKNTKVG